MIKVTVHLRGGLTLVEKVNTDKDELVSILCKGFENMSYFSIKDNFLNPEHIMAVKIEEAE